MENVTVFLSGVFLIIMMIWEVFFSFDISGDHKGGKGEFDSSQLSVAAEHKAVYLLPTQE